jgi:hypothetical protein
LLWSFQAAIDALWPHTWIRKRLKYTWPVVFFLDLTCLPIPLYNIDICVIHIFMQACMQACMHTYIHTNMHAYIHTYRLTYMYTHVCRSSSCYIFWDAHPRNNCTF